MNSPFHLIFLEKPVSKIDTGYLLSPLLAGVWAHGAKTTKIENTENPSIGILKG